jgi:anti-anti-sigma factor
VREGPEPLRFEIEDRLIRLFGDLDTYNASVAFANILELAEANGDRVDIDLTGVAFIDSTGLNTLVRLRNTLPAMRIVAASLRVSRLLELSGLTELLVGDDGAGASDAAGEQPPDSS